MTDEPTPAQQHAQAWLAKRLEPLLSRPHNRATRRAIKALVEKADEMAKG